MLLDELVERVLDTVLESDWYDANLYIFDMLEERYPLFKDKIEAEDIFVGKAYISNVRVEMSENFTYQCNVLYPELLI